MEIIISIVFGLCIGSFLNVVIYRLPLMLENRWRRESNNFLNLANDEPQNTVNLITPRSHCPSCKMPIKAWHNIPIISYFLLSGKCTACQKKISLRYPFVEFLTAAMTTITVIHFGWQWQSIAAIFFTWSLIALTFIDIDHQLLPDEITIPLLWSGLIVNIFHGFTSLESAVIGAIAGYLILWVIAKLFKLIRKTEGMGHGDFKLLATLGAWLGWKSLLPIILVSSIVGIVVGIIIILRKKLSSDTPLPFGPYLALAGWLILIWGQHFRIL